jgi:hypothetical protein
VAIDSHLDFPPPAGSPIDPQVIGLRPRQPVWPSVVEVLGSVTAVAMVGALVLNWLSVYLVFFGIDVVVEPEDVRNYWVIVAVLALSEVATFAGAALRPARGAWVWHVLVAGLGAVAAVLFSVTTVGPVNDQPAPPQPRYTIPECHSGGDASGCPGG